ncbi:hypothetical protein CLV47_113103 [Antricoccus suffuscus]|uniref:Uncharacterized protein n=1 Tax=Antricoccus suffuscus TaxID=1629062 RepID=A0A2T0ZXH2_9ACTN|nr:hypothetical protein [Antricoccus suffuscus]PRZ40937.1 hypothetical protein CLV47_113103 [Antricoccus suffuscus]
MTAKRWTALVIALSAICVLIAGLRTVTESSNIGAPGKADRVVIVSVPGLEWAAISETGTPHLWNAANEGAVGLITNRAARAVTCPWDGWVTLGAGNRARYPAPVPEDELPPEGELPLPGEGQLNPDGTTPTTPQQQAATNATKDCLGQRGTVPTTSGSKLTAAIVENKKLGFGAVPGALGTQVACTTTVGRDPILAVGAKGAKVNPAPRPTNADGWATLATHCPLTLVASGTPEGKTPAEIAALDESVGKIIDGAKKAGATVIVAGISQPDYRRSHLQAIIAVGAGLDGKILSSPSTGRSPYIQLIDIAPTVIRMMGGKAPNSMVGQPATTSDRDQSMSATVAKFADLATAAAAHVWISSDFFNILAVICALASLLLFVAIKARWRPRGWLQVIAIAAGTLPAASFLCNFVPWWRGSSPGTAIVLVIAGATALLTAVCFAGPWRRHPSGPPLVAAGLTVAILGIDVLTGSYLAINSPLGYDAIVAGRFTGFGNIAFSVFAGALMMIIGLTVKTVSGSRAREIGVVAAIGVAAIAIDGAPGAGSDFGGVVSLVPSLLLLGLIAARIRVSIWRLLAALAGGAIVVILIAVGDYLRPEQSQTHLGRFVGQVLDGTAFTVIGRKLHNNLGLFTRSVFTPLTLVLIVICVLVYRDKARQVIGYLEDKAPYASAAAVGIIVVAVVGFAINDSGIALIGGTLAVTVPLGLSIVSRQRPTGELARERESTLVA